MLGFTVIVHHHGKTGSIGYIKKYDSFKVLSKRLTMKKRISSKHVMNGKRLTNMVHWTSITYLSNKGIINMLNFSYDKKVKVSQVFLKRFQNNSKNILKKSIYEALVS